MAERLKATVCPEGTYAYRESCLTQGEFGKSVNSTTYVVGQSLPISTTILPLPDTVVTTLTPLPTGYAYGRVDEDVFVINSADRRIVDTVTLYEVK